MSIHCIMGLWSKECLLVTVMNLGKTTKYLYKGGCIWDGANAVGNSLPAHHARFHQLASESKNEKRGGKTW